MAGFLFGFLLRQPSINNLKKQVEILQHDNAKLIRLHNDKQEQFKTLLVQHKALKAFSLGKKAASKEKLEENLTFQYALYDYLKLLIKCIKQGLELESDEITFFKVYEKVIDGKEISTSDKAKIKNYTLSKYSKEIKELKECDLSAITGALEALK